MSCMQELRAYVVVLTRLRYGNGHSRVTAHSPDGRTTKQPVQNDQQFCVLGQILLREIDLVMIRRRPPAIRHKLAAQKLQMLERSYEVSPDQTLALRIRPDVNDVGGNLRHLLMTNADLICQHLLRVSIELVDRKRLVVRNYRVFGDVRKHVEEFGVCPRYTGTRQASMYLDHRIEDDIVREFGVAPCL
jgi:hypothetical protein